MQFTALIYKMEDEAFFTLLLDNKKVYFYLQKHLVKTYGKYLRSGTYVTFEFLDKRTKHKGIYSYQVLYFYRICSLRNKFIHRTFYDLDNIREGIKNLVNTMNPILFIDFEMNMQDYKPILNFEQEIIEAGMVLTNQKGAIRKMEHYFIKPTKFPRLTARTMRFLDYNANDLKSAISFTKFYNRLKEINDTFHPYVIVWGKSDITQLEKCIAINGLKPLNLHFVNLLQLHINYDNLANCPGLFSQYEAYTNTSLPSQTHDSLEDAMVTKDVFFLFKAKINRK